MNDIEARELFKETNLVKIAKKILKLDSDYAIIKKGEHGALMFTENSSFFAPGYPLENVKDPTNAGDVFAGAFLGYLAKTKRVSKRNIKRAIIYGSVLASFNSEGFGVSVLAKLSKKDVKKRFKEFKKMVKF